MHATNQFNEYPGNAPTRTLRPRLRDADYLAMICHEIATPLSSIIGLSHLLATTECSPKRKSECSKMLLDSSNMLMGLMKNMLDSSKIDAGMIEIEKVDFNLMETIREVTSIMVPKAADKSLELRVHVGNDVPAQCVGDPLRLRQILLNLLSNAVKFTQKGNVTLHVNVGPDRNGGDRLRIKVADTGIGMSEDALEKIFGKYTQANASVSRKYGGTGLGLSISRELAHLMHGEIAVKSWPGMGSHFIVTLPLVTSKTPRSAA